MILAENNEKTHIQISDETGWYSMTSHHVFPGITFIYNDAHIQSVRFEERKTISSDIIEINHCREGRMECNVHNEFCYLTPGDLAISHTNSVSISSYFPSNRYYGLTIQIDLGKTPKCLSCLLDDVTVKPKDLAEKFCGKKKVFTAREKPEIEHIFSELYSVPETIQKGYFKVKALELLLFLSELDTNQDETEKRINTKSQLDLAKEISRYMLERKGDRITLENLTEHFHISGAHIKKTFKGVYGISLGTYIRTQKMESAAYMLEFTDKSILDIANEHGYANGSKFAGAFRAVKGVNPTEYRNFVSNNQFKNI